MNYQQLHRLDAGGLCKIFRRLRLPISFLLAVLVVAQTLFQVAIGVEQSQPVIDSPSVILIEKKSGKVLWENNADEHRQVASTTKVMTALLVLEKLGIREPVVISDNAARLDGNKVNYQTGDQRSAEEMLYSLLLLSANDVATAFAEKIAGSESAFVEMMNLKSAQLGAVNSRFANPHGLPSAGPQYSTARDMSNITLQAMKHPIFRKIVSTREHDFILAGGAPPKKLENSNKLLKAYPFATGIKTGYTRESGYCLVASASRGGMTLIAVILGGRTRENSFNDARSLFDYGFNNFTYRSLIVKGKTYKQVKLPGLKKKLELVADKEDTILVFDHQVSFSYETKVNNISLPVTKGMVLGELIVSQNGSELAREALVAKENVKRTNVTEKSNWFFSVLKNLSNFLNI